MTTAFTRAFLSSNVHNSGTAIVRITIYTALFMVTVSKKSYDEEGS